MDFGRSFCLGHLAEVNQWQIESRFDCYALYGLALLFGESSAKGFVAPEDLVEALLECSEIKRAGDVQSNRDIIERAARFPLIQKPQPLLRKRKPNSILTASLGYGLSEQAG